MPKKLKFIIMKKIIFLITTFLLSGTVFSQVSPTVLNFPSKGGNQTIELSLDTAKWKCMCDNGDFVLNKTSGKGKAEITVFCSENKGKEREGNIVVLYYEEQIQVNVALKQATEVPEKLIITGITKNHNVNYKKGKFFFKVNKDVEFVTTEQNWINDVTYSYSSKTINVSYDANSTKNNRIGTIVIQTKDGLSEIITLIQEGKKIINDEIADNNEGFNSDKNSFNDKKALFFPEPKLMIDNNGDSKSIILKNAKKFDYEIIYDNQAQQDWVKITKFKDSLMVFVDINSGKERSCKIILRKKKTRDTCIIIQRETISQNVFAVKSFDPYKTNTFTVLNFLEASSNNDWIIITAQDDGNVKFQCKENETEFERTGTITVTFTNFVKDSITISQEGKILVKKTANEILRTRVLYLFIASIVFAFFTLVFFILFLVIYNEFRKLYKNQNKLAENYHTFQTTNTLWYYEEEKTKTNEQIKSLKEANRILTERNEELQKINKE